MAMQFTHAVTDMQKIHTLAHNNVGVHIFKTWQPNMRAQYLLSTTVTKEPPMFLSIDEAFQFACTDGSIKEYPDA